MHSTTDSERNAIDEVDVNVGVNATCETNGFIDQVLSSNGKYSGDLADKLLPMVPVQTKVVSNQFVQVGMQGSIDVLSLAPMQMVGSQQSVLSTPLLTNQLTNELTQITDVTNILTLEEGSISTNSIENLPLISILPYQPAIAMEIPTATTNTEQLYIVEMTVESDDSPPPESEENSDGNEERKKEDERILDQLAAPRLASTPKPEEHTAVPDPNEMILAGNINQEKVDTVATSCNNENLQPRSSLREVSTEKVDTAGRTEPCKQIQLPHQIGQTLTLNMSETTHNKTYCKEWLNNIGKVDPEDPNIMLAQGDSVENTSYGLSSLNITSILRNKPPEYRAKENEKFVSQKSKLKNTRLQKITQIDNPVWYVLSLIRKQFSFLCYNFFT